MTYRDDGVVGIEGVPEPDVATVATYKDSHLSEEIQVEIARETERNGVRIDADQMAFRVIRKHLPDFRKYTDFITNAVWGHVRKITGAELRKWKIDEGNSPSMELPGFDRLQDYYESESVEGNAVRLHRIRRDAMTAAQRRAVASELRTKGEAYIDHANQLDRETDELVAAGLLDDEE